MKLGTSWIKKGLLLATGTLGLAFAVQTGAQVQTTTTTTAGETRYNVTVNRGEVYAVDGNDLIVKLADGTFRHFPDVPESARATVDGKQLGIHDLKPGMKLQRTIVTTETPMIVTTIETVKGKVWHVNPPSMVILTLENNTNQQFKIPKDQKFNVDGQMVDAFALRKGMNVTATKIVEVPTVVVAQEQSVTGTAPHAPPKEVATKPVHVTGTVPPAPAPDAPVLVAASEPTPVPAEAETPAAPPTEQPAPAPESHFPWTWLVVLLLVVLLAIWFIRSKSKKQER
jgi:hypothetical protein